MFEDKTLPCTNCGADFIFTAGEQQFFKEKNLKHEPRACANCRVLKRAVRAGKSVASTSEVDCASCGRLTRVPFRPAGHKPVYCEACFYQTSSKTKMG